MERYCVRVDQDELRFSAGHFITIGDSECESLHGHDFYVSAEVEGPLNRDHLVVDFIALKRVILGILSELDHRVLLPERSSRLEVHANGDGVRVLHREKEWRFPRGDCALLPVENTTSELLARWIATRLRIDLAREVGESIEGRITIEVQESRGQSAVYETTTPRNRGT